MAEYEKLTDEQLILELRSGDIGVIDFLLEKYKNLVRKKANSLFLLGGDNDDLIQEGMIGLFKAIRDYEEGRSSFYTFADLCITRQMYTAIEAASRKKHGPLNSYISLSGANRDEKEGAVLSALPDDHGNPEEMLIHRETMQQYLAEIRKNLSAMEMKVLDLYLEGMNYRQIAEAMGKKEKSIDNALQRIKGKIQKTL